MSNKKKVIKENECTFRAGARNASRVSSSDEWIVVSNIKRSPGEIVTVRLRNGTTTQVAIVKRVGGGRNRHTGEQWWEYSFEKC